MKIISELFSLIFVCLLATIIFSCQKDPPKVIPIISTTAAFNITSTTATTGGTISSDGNTFVIVRGVCWSTSQNPTTADFKTSDGSGIGNFTSNITLNPGATYYARAYATNSVGTAYGNQITITTTAILPTISTTVATSITTTTAISGGNINNDGGVAVIARGVCWSTSKNPTIMDSKTTDDAGIGSFTSNVIGLNPGVTYYVRAYATNSVGTTYGNQITITTTAILATISTSVATSITPTTAISGGNINNDGGVAVIARGICWSTSQNPTITDSNTTNGAGIGSFTSNITGLNPGITYYARAYATNSVGTAYGNQIIITTPAKPVAVSKPVANLKITSATLVAMVIPNDPVTNIAFEYKASLDANWITIPISGNFSGKDSIKVTTDVSNLTPNAEYVFRVKANNAGGEVISNESNFQAYSVTDYDGNFYHTVTIGTQVWLKENLKTTHFANGDPIPNVTDNYSWMDLSTGAYCWYNNDPEYGKVHGALYNWWIGADPRGLIDGWSVGTDKEWFTLTDFLGGNFCGGKLKEAGTSHWQAPNTGATNESGFTALPAGCRNDASGFFEVLYTYVYFLNTSDIGTSFWVRILFSDKDFINDSSGVSKKGGFSIRLLKD